MTSVRDLIAHLERNFDPDARIAVALWQLADVRSRAEARGLAVSDATAVRIIERMDANHDATLGITWETVDDHLDDL
ncbi:MAG: hypothetical protein GC150_07405 [Rhizobiales bacterium]|nr:hypothetical protein [Hyphomicrobiales bacterium]